MQPSYATVCLTLKVLKMLQLHKFKILNSSKTWPDRENLTTVLKSAPQNYPENALKPQSPWNSFKIVDLYNGKWLRRFRSKRFGCNKGLLQGRNEGGHNSLGALNHCRGVELLLEAPKSPNNVTSTFFNTVNLPSKELRFDHRGAKPRPWARRFDQGAPNLLFAPDAI